MPQRHPRANCACSACAVSISGNHLRRAQNMPSCWDGKNVDSPNHTSHVAFPSGGPDSGTCNDPRYPVTLPRIFMEVCAPHFSCSRMSIIGFCRYIGIRVTSSRIVALQRTRLSLTCEFSCTFHFAIPTRRRYSYGDRTGYGYHADFFNGWDAGVLQRAVDQCHCNPYGDPTCCAQAGFVPSSSSIQKR